MDKLNIKDIIADLKEEIENPMAKVASQEAQEPSVEDVDLSDLGFEITTKQQVSEGLQKIASALDKTDTLEELVKVAEEAGNTDIADLVKIADAIADRIALRVVEQIKKAQ